MSANPTQPTGLRVFLMGTGGYASIILQTLLDRGEAVVGVCCGRKTAVPGPKARIVRTSRRIGRLVLDNVGVYTPRGFAFQSPFDGVESPAEIASRLDIPVLSPRALRTPSFEGRMRRLTIDVVLVAGFRRLIPLNIIKLPGYAAVNFHTSLLPKHRGGTPTRWVIRYGERETGITVHELSEEYDTGGIILQEKLIVRPDETYGELEVRLAHLASEMAPRVLDIVATGAGSTCPQSEEMASYEPSYRGPHQWIDWDLPPEDIKRLCYAIRPSSGGLTSFSQKAVCVWDVEVVDAHPRGAPPGSIIEMENGLPLVACGSGALRILECLAGGKIVAASKIAKRTGMKAGAAFDMNLSAIGTGPSGVAPGVRS